MSSKFQYQPSSSSSSSSSIQLHNQHHHQLPTLQMHHQQHQHHHSHQASISTTLNRQKCQQQQEHYQQQIKFGKQQEFNSSFESFLHTSAAAEIALQQSLIHHKHLQHSQQMPPSRIINDDNNFRFGSNNKSMISESGDQDGQDEQSSSCGYGPIIENYEMDYVNDVNDEKEHKNSHYNSLWIFKEDFIVNHTPSRQNGINYVDEIEYRRKGTKFIRDLTKLLKLKPICKETAYVYFHRFFMLRSFTQYDPIRIAMASLYFACKYEDHPLPKDHLIQVSYMLINNYVNKQQYKLNQDDKEYIEYCDRLIMDENLMIQLLGFDNLRVTHFQVLVVESYSRNQIAGTTQELYTAAYQIASELNRLTTLCLEYSAPFLAAVSIYLAACYKTIRLPDDWCKTIITDMKNPINTKKMIIQIGEKYREQLSSSQLIQKILSEEYRNQYCSPSKSKTSEQKSTDQQKQHPALGSLLMTNFSPDSAYSSSSSTAAAYSPAEIQHTMNRNMSDDRKTRPQVNQSNPVGQNFRSMLNNNTVGGSQQQQRRSSNAANSNSNYQNQNNNNSTQQHQQQHQTSKKRSISNVINNDNNNSLIVNNNNNNDDQFNFAQQQQRKIDYTNINNNSILNNRHNNINNNNLINQHRSSLISGNINNNNNNINNQLIKNLQTTLSNGNNNNNNKKMKLNHQNISETNHQLNEYYRYNNNNSNNIVNNNNNRQQQQQLQQFYQQNAAFTIQQQLGLMFQQHSAATATVNAINSGVVGGIVGDGIVVGNNNTNTIVNDQSFQQQQQQHHRKNM